MTDGRGIMGDSEWQDQCRRWTGNRNGRFSWQGPEGPGRDEGGEGGGGSRGHRVVGGGSGTGLVPEGGRAEVGGLVTDTWVVSEGGCASAVSGDLRSGAPHTHYLSTSSLFHTPARRHGTWNSLIYFHYELLLLGAVLPLLAADSSR